MREFRQVDVFCSDALRGNPVAVVHDGDDVTDEQMQAFARWTNLSETTFLLTPGDPGADYRLRIFTPGAELPFAGHPTIGSAHAWLEAGGRPASAGRIVQECGAGLVTLRQTDGRLAFAAPPLVRSGAVSEEDLAAVAAALGIDVDEVLDAAWVDNGPGWMGLLLRDAERVLSLRPDFSALRQDVGVVGARESGDTACEVRAFCPPDSGITEDPVTGSLNAGLAMWLAGTVLPTSYVAAQGTAIGRRGRVHVEVEQAAGGGTTVWVAGDALSTITGVVNL